MNNIVKCMVCGKEVLLNQKYCSLTCRRIEFNKRRRDRRSDKRQPVPCKWCGKEFKPATTIQVFCSEECQTKNYMKESMGVKQVGYRGTGHLCEICGKQYKAYNPQSKYCSIHCQRQRWNQKLRERTVRDSYSIKRECLLCTKTFSGKRKNARFCSNFCGRKYYRLINCEVIKESKRKYHKKNKELISTKVRNWQKLNPEKKYLQYRLRVYRKKQGGGSFTYEQWLEILESQKYNCADCGIRMKYPFKQSEYGRACATADHVIPLSKWKEWAEINKPTYQANDIENIQARCLSCNSSKSNKISSPHITHDY